MCRLVCLFEKDGQLQGLKLYVSLCMHVYLQILNSFWLNSTTSLLTGFICTVGVLHNSSLAFCSCQIVTCSLQLSVAAFASLSRVLIFLMYDLYECLLNLPFTCALLDCLHPLSASSCMTTTSFVD